MLYEGWDNYTQFEKEFIQKVIEEMKKKHNIDLTVYKEFGPHTADFKTDETTQKVVNGRDGFFMNS